MLYLNESHDLPLLKIYLYNWQVFETKLGSVFITSKGITAYLQGQPGLHGSPLTTGKVPNYSTLLSEELQISFG